MRPISSPQKLTRSAAVALVLWLLVVVAVVLWRRPEFWIEPEQRFRRAEVLASEHKWSEALAAVEPALASDPNNAGYLTFRGYRQLDVGDDAGAHASFGRAIQSNPSLVEARLGAASALARLGRRDDAAAMLQTLSPETIAASQLHRRSQLYSAIGAREAALADVSLLLHSDPGNSVFLKDAAELTLMLGQWDRAASFLERLESAADDPHVREWAVENRNAALEGAAYAAVLKGRLPEATDHFRLLSERNPDNARFRRDRAHALRAAGRLGEAEVVFRELLADSTADTATREAFAWLLNTQHRYAEAWQVIEPLPRPATDETLLELQVRTAIWSGQDAESIHLIRALLNRRPADAELWKRLSDAFQKIKDDRQAADALAVYVRLHSHDWQARERLAQILSRLGSLRAAMAEYQQLLAAEPNNPHFLRSLGLLQETAGDLDEAAGNYRRAIDVSHSVPPELLLRVARLQRWTKRPDAAVHWYERYLAREAADAPFRTSAEAELALSLLESGNAAAAATRLKSLKGPLDAAALEVGARASTANAQPAEAAGYLELLSRVRALTTAEEIWLAGQYRASGNIARALATYERAAARAGEPVAEVLEAVGDLRFDAGNYSGALSAFQQVDGDDIGLKVARSAARAGQLSVASEMYDRFVKSHPNERAALLEAARFNAISGRPHAALAQYREYIKTQGAADLRLELARVSLAAEQFDNAEGWARQAIAAGEHTDTARLALTQSLHLLGRHQDARAVLVELLRDAPASSGAHEWRGHVAVALDRHLEAFRAFDRAIAVGSGEPGKLRILHGTAALKRGDYARASRGYAAAAAAGADPAAVDAARRQLRSATLPGIDVPLWSLGDSNGLSVTQAGGAVLFFLPSFRGEIALEGAGGVLSQRHYSAAASSMRLTLSRLFPRPELNVDVAVGLNQYEGGPDLLTWHAGGVYHLGERAAIGVQATREALLPFSDRKQLRQFNRVLDLESLGPGFRSDVFLGLVELAAGGTNRARIETGIENFQDGNRRSFAYFHFQIPTTSSARSWTAIRPNVFFERFRDARPFYYSPGHHVTVGTMLHTIRRPRGWLIESEINPQLLMTDGAAGAGGHALLNIGRRIGTASLTGGAFVFWDGLENHLQWRLGGRVTVPLAH